jgi:hypothetical protein
MRLCRLGRSHRTQSVRQEKKTQLSPNGATSRARLRRASARRGHPPPPPPAPMAAAPSRCLLVTGPPVSNNSLQPAKNPLLSGPPALTTASLLAGRGEDDAGHAAGGNPQSVPAAPHCSRILHPYWPRRSPSPDSFACAVQFAPRKFHSSCCLFAGEVRENGERVGFEVVTLDGRTGRLASSKICRCLQLLLKSISDGISAPFPSDGHFSSATIRTLVYASELWIHDL